MAEELERVILDRPGQLLKLLTATWFALAAIRAWLGRIAVQSATSGLRIAGAAHNGGVILVSTITATAALTVYAVVTVSALLPGGITNVGAPRGAITPSTGTETVLMDKEAAASMTRDIATVSRIYAPNAYVIDAACRSPGSSVTWAGLDAITARYRALPRFASLRHVHAEVRWEPDNSRAAKAIVTAQTVGEMESSAGSLQYIHGNEVWTFARLGGTWVITSFTYNVCY
jgi:hypothetical protein